MKEESEGDCNGATTRPFASESPRRSTRATAREAETQLQTVDDANPTNDDEEEEENASSYAPSPEVNERHTRVSIIKGPPEDPSDQSPPTTPSQKVTGRRNRERQDEQISEVSKPKRRRLGTSEKNLLFESHFEALRAILMTETQKRQNVQEKLKKSDEELHFQGKEIEQLKQQNRQATQDLVKQNNELRAEIKRSKNQLREKEDQAQQVIKGMAIEISDLTRKSQSHKVADGTIVEKWEQVAYIIRNCVSQALTCHPNEDENTIGPFGMPGVADPRLSPPQIRQLYLQRHIWRKICRIIASSPKLPQHPHASPQELGPFRSWKGKPTAQSASDQMFADLSAWVP